MIGKNVTVDKSRFAHQKGMISPVNFTLPEDAEKIRLTILDERGEEVASRELEPMKAGMNVYNWDGINSSSLLSGSGTYLVRVDAENSQGKKIKIDSVNRDTVVGVSFDGGETHFLVGDSKNPQKVNFKNVIRIESDAPQKVAAPVQDSRPGESSAQLGVADSLPPGLQEKLNREMAQSAIEDQSTGFPNGLSNE